MSFYDDIYYNLEESDREIFINSLSEEEKNELLGTIKRNNLYLKNASDKQREKFTNIYERMMKEKDKDAFLYIFNNLNEEKRYLLLEMLFNNINTDALYFFNDFNDLKNICKDYEKIDMNKLLRFSDDTLFKRLLKVIIDIKMSEILKELYNYEYSLVNNSYIKMNSYKHKYKGKSSEKLLNILFNIPRERRIFFFEEFKNNDHIKNNEFIKMLEVILDMDEELFLDIFEDINKESYIHKSYNIYSSQVCRNIYFDYYSSINSFYEILKSDIECKVFFRVLESVLKFKVKELLEVFDSLGEDIRENFLLLSYYITFENIENYLNIFSYTEESKEEEIEIVNSNYIDYKYISKCKEKIKDIIYFSEDFEYAVKEYYNNACLEIENILDFGISDKYKLNEIIDDINQLYRTAYYKKYNKSTLLLIMDIDDEIELMEKIEI